MATMVLLSSCSKENADSRLTKSTEEEAAGKFGMWSMTSLPESTKSVTYNFHDDGTCDYQIVADAGGFESRLNHKLVWELEGDVLTMESRLVNIEDYLSSYHHYEVVTITHKDDKTMTWKRPMEGLEEAVIEFVRVK